MRGILGDGVGGRWMYSPVSRMILFPWSFELSRHDWASLAVNFLSWTFGFCKRGFLGLG